MATYEIMRDDTEPLEAVLEDRLGPVDLTNANVTFVMRKDRALAPKAQGACVVDPDQTAHRGKVTYAWAAGETDTADVYRAQFQVVFSTGKRLTFPNDGYEDLRVLADLT